MGDRQKWMQYTFIPLASNPYLVSPPSPSLLMQFPPTSSQVTSRGIPSQLKLKQFLPLILADLYLALREDCSAEDHWWCTTPAFFSVLLRLALGLTKIFDSCQTWGNPETPSEEDSSMLLQTVSNFNFVLCETCLRLSKSSRFWNNPTNVRPHFKSHLPSQNLVT